MSLFEKPAFEPAPALPLYQQLGEHLRMAILSGRLKKGAKLPSTRMLADELGISRNTVLNVYDQLLAEGYLESVRGSGTFVASVLPEMLLSKPIGEAVSLDVPPILNASPHLSQQAELVLDALKIPEPLYDHSGRIQRAFHPALPALDAFPFELWSKLVAKKARHLYQDLLAYRDIAGYRPLREAIADHATMTRRVHCTPDQVIIVSGSQGGLHLAARVLLDPGDPAWIEDPGYIGARGALLSVGANLIPVPVDQEGIIVEAGVASSPQARLVYVTPSHQFPLGVTMSLNRRLALLEWARQANAYILEDDYDSAYRYAGRPLASLQGLDTAGRVIYIGTLSKVLFPSLRLGYVIVPPALVDAFLAMRSTIDFHPPMLEQLALAEFIAEGHFTRHLRRMRSLYAKRRLMLLEAVRGLPFEVDAPEAGMHFVGWLPAGIDDTTIAQQAALHDVCIIPISTSGIAPRQHQGIMLGFAAVNQQDIASGVRRLQAAFHSL